MSTITTSLSPVSVAPGADTALTTTTYPLEQWNKLQYAVSCEDIESVRSLLNQGIDANWTSSNRATPQVTPLHIACRLGNLEMVRLLLPFSDPNKADQWGFRPLHYATVARQRDVALELLSAGAIASVRSKTNVTPRQLAELLNLTEVLDALTSKETLEKDPLLPLFHDWLSSLGAGEYTSRFVDAGYDLKFVAREGLTDADLDCVGIPIARRGLRRKISSLHGLNDFYNPSESEEGSDEESEEGSDEESEEGSEEESD